MKKRPVLLTILDGFGLAPPGPGNGIESASTPVFDMLKEKYPFVYGYAGGEAVGLPKGQMGNSEVGHLNIGAGRIIYQELTRISKSIEDGDFFGNAAFLQAVDNCKKNNSSFHIMGLLSDGGVHSLDEHMFALIRMAAEKGLQNIYIHAFMDGRDTAPDSGALYMQKLADCLDETGTGRVATVTGRYYAMDRDNRWERVIRAYKAITEGEGIDAADPVQAVKDSYEKGVTDEFIEPVIIKSDDGSNGTVDDGDSVVFINFRPDRARELTRAFCDDDFEGFERGKRKDITFVCMTDYDPLISNKLVAFEKEKIENTFGEYISSMGLKQLRLAETEKYAHVTFFFNGGIEEPYGGEDRILIPSPKVATYDLQPEMSAVTVCDKLVEALESDNYDCLIVNFANPDMVGHTGVLEAVIKAIETIDDCLGRIYKTVLEKDAVWFICADHGNAECMIDDNGAPMTAHTTNPVPFILVNYDESCTLNDCKGRLCDIIPTLLEIMDIRQPEEMTGHSLLKRK